MYFDDVDSFNIYNIDDSGKSAEWMESSNEISNIRQSIDLFINQIHTPAVSPYASSSKDHLMQVTKAK